MEKKEILADDIKAKIAELKNSKKRIYTNCYAENQISQAQCVWSSNNTIIFSYQDHGINRLLYYTFDFNDAAALLQGLDKQEYMLEFLTKDAKENRELLEAQGWKRIGKLMRISNINCRNVFDNSKIVDFFKQSSFQDIRKKNYQGNFDFFNDNISGYFDTDVDAGQIAVSGEEHEINQILWSVFDTRISHLLSDEEIKEAINRGEITIHRKQDGNIDAVLQTVVQPQKFYINQIYNCGQREIIHAMLLSRLKKYCDSGGKYLYAWVEEQNIASVRFHQKYGMKHDGMWNVVYQKNGN